MVGLTKLQEMMGQIVEITNGDMTIFLENETKLPQLCREFDHELNRMLPFVREELQRLSLV